MPTDQLDTRRSDAFGRLVARINLRIARDLARKSDLNRDLSSAQKSALIHVEVSGSRVTAIAARLGVTKQAASKLVMELEAKDLVQRAPDPSDLRSSIISFTKKGRKIVEDTVNYFEELERDISNEIGADDLTALKDGIRTVANFLDPKGF